MTLKELRDFNMLVDHQLIRLHGCIDNIKFNFRGRIKLRT
jgi:hypothetical protein